MPELTADRIQELRASGLPSLADTELDYGGVEGLERRAEIKKYLEEHGHAFALPDDKGSCLNCGHRQSGLLGAFAWGIVHGEGRCAPCGWPARAYHYYGERDRCFVAILQYHPDHVSIREAADA